MQPEDTPCTWDMALGTINAQIMQYNNKVHLMQLEAPFVPYVHVSDAGLVLWKSQVPALVQELVDLLTNLCTSQEPAPSQLVLTQNTDVEQGTPVHDLAELDTAMDEHVGGSLEGYLDSLPDIMSMQREAVAPLRAEATTETLSQTTATATALALRSESRVQPPQSVDPVVDEAQMDKVLDEDDSPSLFSDVLPSEFRSKEPGVVTSTPEWQPMHEHVSDSDTNAVQPVPLSPSVLVSHSPSTSDDEVVVDWLRAPTEQQRAGQKEDEDHKAKTQTDRQREDANNQEEDNQDNEEHTQAKATCQGSQGTEEAATESKEQRQDSDEAKTEKPNGTKPVAVRNELGEPDEETETEPKKQLAPVKPPRKRDRKAERERRRAREQLRKQQLEQQKQASEAKSKKSSRPKKSPERPKKSPEPSQKSNRKSSARAGVTIREYHIRQIHEIHRVVKRKAVTEEEVEETEDLHEGQEAQDGREKAQETPRSAVEEPQGPHDEEGPEDEDCPRPKKQAKAQPSPKRPKSVGHFRVMGTRWGANFSRSSEVVVVEIEEKRKQSHKSTLEACQTPSDTARKLHVVDAVEHLVLSWSSIYWQLLPKSTRTGRFPAINHMPESSVVCKGFLVDGLMSDEMLQAVKDRRPELFDAFVHHYGLRADTWRPRAKRKPEPTKPRLIR